MGSAIKVVDPSLEMSLEGFNINQGLAKVWVVKIISMLPYFKEVAWSSRPVVI